MVISIMKYIFLDIDGVLNASGDKEIVFNMMEVNKLELFVNFVLEVDASVVITSSRRIYKEEVNMIKLALAKINNVSVLSEKRIHKHRGNEIEWYITENKINNFVIFDDNDDMISDKPLLNNHFILVDYLVGLTKEDIMKAKEILKL